MSKNNKEYDIEKLFQKAAEDFPAAFDEKDWQAMKGMLDQERDRAAGVRRKKIGRLTLSLAVFLLLSVLLYLFLPGNKEQHMQSREGKQDQIQNFEQRDPTDKAPQKTFENGWGIEKNERESSNPTVDFSSSDPKEETLVTNDHSKADPSGVFAKEKKESGKLQSANSAYAEKRSEVPKSEKKLVPESGEQQESAQDDSKNLQKKNSNTILNNKKASSNTIPSATGSDEESISPSRSSIRTEKLLEINEKTEGKGQQTNFSLSPDPNAIVEEEKEEKIKKPIIKEEEEEELPFRDTRLSARIVFGPDLSALRLGKLTTPGYSYGLMFHYHINSKLLIGVGALKSTKKYLGEGDDYNIPSAYWKYATNDIIPDRVAGECAILEVPLDLQYNVMTSKKYNFYLAGGISSYFMLSETYKYTFNDPNPYANDSWSSDDADGKHLLNIINFSVGYERTISQRLKLGIAPYVKIPIRGIGWSNVKFVSMGTYFTIGYDLVQKKR